MRPGRVGIWSWLPAAGLDHAVAKIERGLRAQHLGSVMRGSTSPGSSLRT